MCGPGADHVELSSQGCGGGCVLQVLVLDFPVQDTFRVVALDSGDVARRWCV